MNKITKLLIANRGEIAIRIMKTAKNMGIKTVAIYSEPDASAEFVKYADESVALGGVTSRESYLIIDKIIDACKKTGANAVHPGYGFLSEKPDFVERCEKENIIFVGPSSKSMQMMGDKVTSKETASKAGVNVVPGFLGIINDAKDAEKIAKDIGFPVIIKASAGGGGKGMKIVYDIKELISATESAKNEARNAFGDDRIFIEKYIERPHHIEIQLIADKHGNVVCLGERECSIQRFNQKVIEESPSPFVNEETRQKMYDQSVKLAKACGYYSAGTIEYIMDDNQNFYFLEMNTRLQVEHPVTEYVTQKDLVSLMIKVAQGEKLEFSQKDIKLIGSSIECRLCAENPAKGFMPSIGRITTYKEPQKMHNVKFRIDSGVAEGSEVTPYYDSMIAKVITYGDTRKEAIESMKKTLGQFEIGGISTNINLLEDIIRNDVFTSGKLSTWFIKEQYPNGFKGVEITDKSKRDIIFASIIIQTSLEKKLWSGNEKFNLTRDKNENIIDVVIDKDVFEVRYNFDVDNELKVRFNNEDFVIRSEYKNSDMIVKGQVNDLDFAVKILEKKTNEYLLNSRGVVVHAKTLPR